MKINQSQQRALLQIFTARSWPQRLSAIIIIAVAAFTWWNQQQSSASPGVLAKNSEITGEVVGVADGDTITVLDDAKQQYKLRLAYIDAPEKAMPFGQAAKENLSNLVYRQTITAHIDDVDRYGRGVARIAKAGQDINLQQVSAGFAWHYQQYAAKTQSRSDFSRYESAQAQAQAGNTGLWVDAQPTPPWEWRKANR